ncbi:HD domain-containing phosphohydrolase [Sulfurospirillum sp. 1612]|uniref:HD domain-containing phosphohydrolase n=1 Tax=Sulfurospirillum sp. 1612 TaxID=3094835 RepID=UPI002F94D879
MKNNITANIKSLIEKAKNLEILYVEDEKDLREKTAAFFRKIFTHIDIAIDGKDGLEKYQSQHYDLIITDILMPKMNGIEFIRNIRKQNEKQEIIIISAYTELSYLMESIRLGVTGYLIKPLNFEDTLKIIEQSLDKLQAFHDVEMYRTKLETIVEQRTKEVVELQRQQTINYQYAVKSFVKMMERRDTYTSGHSERVAQYSKDIAKELGCTKEECQLIYQAGILHDIGKIMTPDSILLKPGKLTKEEYRLIQEHVTTGYEILSEVPMYKNLADIVYSHHENFDGSGYPRSLKGDAIPLLGRIMIIADAFDAMTTSRIYKSRKTVQEALQELQDLSGTRYDPDIIPSAIRALQTINIDESINQTPKSDIDDERFAYFFKDTLTKAYNHDYLDFILQKNKDEQNFLCFNIIYIKNFTLYNQEHGWDAGDLFLKNFAGYLQTAFEDSKIFRIFGDDFLILSKAHLAIDIDELNRSKLLQENHLRCELRHLESQKYHINSYHDLQSLS